MIYYAKYGPLEQLIRKIRFEAISSGWDEIYRDFILRMD